MYTSNEVDLIKDNIDEKEKKVLDHKFKYSQPTKEDIDKIIGIVLKFVKDNKRKIYGGTAQNAVVRQKSKEDAFYDDYYSIPDIDFYSPTPIEDMYALVNLLFEAGIPFPSGVTAMHDETYKVFADFSDAADISYVPRQIYNRIPFVEIEGIYYCHPSFTTIDLYRMMTNPLNSTNRWTKAVNRLSVMQKYYPFKEARDALPNGKQVSDEVQKALSVVDKFIQNNENAIVVGEYAYNTFLKESGIMKDKSKGKKYKELPVHMQTIVLMNYTEEAKKLYDSINKELDKRIAIIEHYPFFQFTGFNCYLEHDGVVFAHLIDFNRRCTPIKKVGNVQIGSFDITLLYAMVAAFRARVIKESNKYHYYNIMQSHLVEMRNYYLKSTGKNFLEDHLFQEFMVECVGEEADVFRENKLKIKENLLSKKPAVGLRYDPVIRGVQKNPVITFKFNNTSGNRINNPKNFRVLKIAGITQDTRPRMDSESDTN